MPAPISAWAHRLPPRLNASDEILAYRNGTKVPVKDSTPSGYTHLHRRFRRSHYYIPGNRPRHWSGIPAAGRRDPAQHGCRSPPLCTTFCHQWGNRRIGTRFLGISWDSVGAIGLKSSPRTSWRTVRQVSPASRPPRSAPTEPNMEGHVA
jgi:hypothetical protein